MATLNELMIDGQHYRINIAGTYDVWSVEYGDWKPWFPTYRWDRDFKARLKAARAKQLILESDLRSSAVESNPATETEPMWNDQPKELEGGFVRMYWQTLETVVLWGRRLKWIAVGR